MCKTKPVLSEAWAELSPPQRKEWSRRNEEELGGGGGGEGGEGGRGGWVQVRRGKNPRRESKTKQTAQLRTSKIHKTRRQAGGLCVIIFLIVPVSDIDSLHLQPLQERGDVAASIFSRGATQFLQRGWYPLRYPWRRYLVPLPDVSDFHGLVNVDAAARYKVPFFNHFQDHILTCHPWQQIWTYNITQ